MNLYEIFTEKERELLNNAGITVENKNYDKEELKRLDEQLKNLKLAERKINFLDVISQKENDYYDENLVSNWLAFLFNPERNGVGNLTIKALLKTIFPEDDERIDNIDNQEFIVINRELSTDEQKRIDILIEFSKTLILIENKIGSHENGEQTLHYYNYAIKQKDKDIIFIYLKPERNESKPTSDSFIQITYKQLINEFRKIQKTDYKENETYKYRYLKEFEEIGENYMSEENKWNYFIDDEIKVYVENKEKIEKLQQLYKEKEERVRELIIDKIQSKIKGFDVNSRNPAFIQFNQPNWKNEYGKGIHYEVLSTKLFLGKTKLFSICLHIEGDVRNDKELYEKLEENGIKKWEEKINLNFQTDANIEKSIEIISEKIKELDEKYTKKINEVLGDFGE